MPRLPRLLVTIVSAVAVGAAPVLAAGPADAAPVSPNPPGSAPPNPPGKGDSDHDRIADDLEAAVAARAPGDRVGVIVQGTTPDRARAAAPSLTLTHRYTVIPAFSGSVTAGQVRALSRVPGVTRVELDGVTRALDAAGDHDYGVQAARAAGAAIDGTLDGSGIGICVIDTGIDPAHEQLAGRITGWRDWVNGRATPYDDHGHGTHVSGIAAGDGTGSNPATADAYGGVARGASLVGAKVLNSLGSGADSDVVAAIDWCAQRSDVRVVSMSLGSPGGDGGDAGSQAVDSAATAYGKVVIVAAGNDGDGQGTIASPGVATEAITVGAGSDYSAPAGGPGHDDGLYLAGFSSRGPTANPDAPLKPDVVAPGLSVVSAQAGTTSGYVAYSGTSMATPFVAGVVALGLEAAPGAGPAQVKQALQTSAFDAGSSGPDNDWGHGLVDARAFVDTLRGLAPATRGPWPSHVLSQGSVAQGGVTSVPIQVTSSGQPLGVSLRIDGALGCSWWFFGICLAWEWSPDLDASLVDPSGATVASTACPLEASNGNCGSVGRWETLGVGSAAAGTWTLRVVPFADAPNNGKGGTFVADVFGALGAAPPPPPPPPPPPAAAPAAPTNLKASAQSRSSIRLTWIDNATNETGFEIWRCTGRGCTAFTQVGQIGADATAFTDTGLSTSTTYAYRLRAVNTAGPSAWSNTATATTKRR